MSTSVNFPRRKSVFCCRKSVDINPDLDKEDELIDVNSSPATRTYTQTHASLIHLKSILLGCGRLICIAGPVNVWQDL